MFADEDGSALFLFLPPFPVSASRRAVPAYTVGVPTAANGSSWIRDCLRIGAKTFCSLWRKTRRRDNGRRMPSLFWHFFHVHVHEEMGTRLAKIVYVVNSDLSLVCLCFFFFIRDHGKLIVVDTKTVAAGDQVGTTRTNPFFKVTPFSKYQPTPAQ